MATKQFTTAYKSINDNAPRRKVSGIYQIRNILTGQKYVGSAQCFRARWSTHFHLLWDNKNHSRYLQNAWNKHGPNAFVFEVIEAVSGTKEEVIAREQFYLDLFLPEYNISKTAIVSGIQWSEESKARMRKPKSEETKRRMSEGAKRSYELSPALRQSRIDNFRAVRERDPMHNRGPRNGSYGKFFNQDILHTPEMQAKRTLGLRQAHAEGRAKVRIRPVTQLTPDGVIVAEWPSLIAAAKAFGVATAGGISNVCRGRWDLWHGFKWRYAGERA